MAQPQFVGREGQLAHERRSKHVGTASIKLEVLKIQHAVDEDNVDRLVSLLQDSRYDRMAVHNHAIATVDLASLDLALRYSNLSANMLVANEAGIYPTLEFPPEIRLPCLHGADRLTAASRFLPTGDKRWVVDLYLPDISPTLRSALVDAYSGEKERNDGHFYAKIRHYQGIGDYYLEGTWWARLASISVQKKKNLARLLRNPGYRSAFDCQIDMPGLQGGMKLGTIHTMLSMRCDEECLRYLRYVKHVWSMILSQDTVAMQRLDVATVNEVELTAPGYCEEDALRLKGKLRRGEIFKAFSPSERESIWVNMLAVSADRLIPSLRAFFDDVNYLQGPADCMKRLIDCARGSWISRTFRREFTGVNQTPNSYVVQISETQFENRPGASSDQVESGVRHMWTRAMRDHCKIPAQRKKIGKDRLAKSEMKEDETVFCAFGSFAYRLGFETKKIHEVMQRSADREIARNALLKARKPEHYLYDADEFKSYVEKIVSFFNAASEVSKTTSYNPGKGLPNRSGRPKELDHDEDRKVLFMDNLLCPVKGGCGVTSFFVRRSVYLAFFGDPSERPDAQREGPHLNTDQGKTTQHLGATEGEPANVEKMTIEEVQEERSQSGTTNAVQESETVVRNRRVQQEEADRFDQEVEGQVHGRSVNQGQDQEEAADPVQRGAVKVASITSKGNTGSRSFRVEKRSTQIKPFDAQNFVQAGKIEVRQHILQIEADAAQRIQKAQTGALAVEADVKRIQREVDQRIQQIEALAAQRIQKAQADTAAAAAAAKAEAEAQRTQQEVKAAAEAQRIQREAEAAADLVAANSQQIQEAGAKPRIENIIQGLQEEQSTKKRVRLEEKKKNQRAKHPGKEADLMQSNISERAENPVREIRRDPLEQPKRSVSKIRVTRIGVDGSDAYETAQEENEDIAQKEDTSLAEQDNPRALQREEALQTAQETASQHGMRTNVQVNEESALRSPKQDLERSTSLQITTSTLHSQNKRSTHIRQEDVRTQGDVDALETDITKARSFGSSVPQKRQRDEDKAIIKLMMKTEGNWMIRDSISASTHRTWFQGYGLKWELQDSAGKQLAEETCLEDVIQDGTCKIYLVPRDVGPPPRSNRIRVGTKSRILTMGTNNLDDHVVDHSLEVQTKATLSMDSD